VDDGIEIQIFVKVIAQFHVQLAALGAVLNQRLWMTPDIVGGLDAGFLNEAFAVLHHVTNLVVNNGADGEIAAAFVGQCAVFLFHRARRLRTDADVFRQMLFRQQTGIESVIKVVAVIGDFIRKVGNLCFERRIFCVKTFPPVGMVVGGLVFGESFQNFP